MIERVLQHHKDVSSQLIEAILLKIPISLCFMNLDTSILKVMWQNKHARIPRKILKRKIYARGLDLSDIKTYYKAFIIKKCGTGL